MLPSTTRRGFARGLGISFLAFSASTAMPRVAVAQDFPTRPVRIIVPAAAGGALDITARLLGHYLSLDWKHQVYIENRPGANWITGMNATARAAPDGYTLLVMASSGATINPFVFPQMPLDPLQDLAPVTNLAYSSLVLLANNAVPVTTGQEFIAHLHANPGKLNHGSNSALTILTSELFKARAEVNYVDVNFRGASQAIAATIAGTTDFCFVDIGSASGPIDGKLLRPLGVTMRERNKLRPELRTIAEQGLPGFSAISMILLLAPANLPADLLDMINAAAQRALSQPDVITKLQGMGQVVGGGQTPEQLREALLAEAAQWQKLISDRNIQFSR